MTPHPTSRRFILLLSSRLGQVFQVVYFPHVSSPKLCMILSPRNTCYTSHPSHSSRFDHPPKKNTTYRVKSTNHKAPSIVVFSTPVTSSRLGPNIFLSALFSKTLSIWHSLNVRDEVSNPHKTRDRITTHLTFTFYMFRGITGRHENLQRMIASISCLQSAFF